MNEYLFSVIQSVSSAEFFFLIHHSNRTLDEQTSFFQTKHLTNRATDRAAATLDDTDTDTLLLLTHTRELASQVTGVAQALLSTNHSDNDTTT